MINFIKNIIKTPYRILKFIIKICIWWPIKIFIWWPIKLFYNVFIWPFFWLLGFESSDNYDSSSSSTTGYSPRNYNKSNTSSNRGASSPSTSPRGWSIEVYKSNYWQDCHHGSDPNPNYISQQLRRIKKQNNGATVRAYYRDTGQVIDIS